MHGILSHFIFPMDWYDREQDYLYLYFAHAHEVNINKYFPAHLKKAPPKNLLWSNDSITDRNFSRHQIGNVFLVLFFFVLFFYVVVLFFFPLRNVGLTLNAKLFADGACLLCITLISLSSLK